MEERAMTQLCLVQRCVHREPMVCEATKGNKISGHMFGVIDNDNNHLAELGNPGPIYPLEMYPRRSF